MLVLTRRIGESISIGGDITIKVINVCGKQARLGIEARPETPVFRSEIFDLIQNSVKSASQITVHCVENAAKALQKAEFFNLPQITKDFLHEPHS
jgi:carbon storage regulator